MSAHVVIAGGGVGALEGLLALQSLAPDPPRISVLVPGRHFTYRALSVLEPFGGDPAPRYEWPEIVRDRCVRWIPDAVAGVRPDAREIDTHDGPPVGYDALLLAIGAQPTPALPGALTFAGPRDVVALMDAIDGLLGYRRRGRVAFVCVSATSWTLPLYELALLTAERAVRAGVKLAIELVTSEPAPLAVFGTGASAAVAHRLALAGIHVRTGAYPQAVEDGKLLLELDEAVDADLVVALPRLHGPEVPGLPHDVDGFVPVDRFGRVRGTEAIWAVGDMTARPLKQGGLAAQQADVAAADIAARFGASVDVEPYRPALQGLLLAEVPAFLERRTHSSQAAREPLWSPPQKIAGRHLAPYLEQLGAPPVTGASR